MVIWYISPSFWYIASRKNLATLQKARFLDNGTKWTLNDDDVWDRLLPECWPRPGRPDEVVKNIAQNVAQYVFVEINALP
jgi:hypothetical protein